MFVQFTVNEYASARIAVRSFFFNRTYKNQEHLVMSIATIHEAVKETLQKNPEIIKSRRNEVESLCTGLDKFQKTSWPLLRKRNVWFSTTQGDTQFARGKIHVQTLGIEVGFLSLDKKNICRFHPTLLNFVQAQEEAKGGWAWSKNRRDANIIKDYLKRCEKHSKANMDNEREIQWQLADALKRPTDEALRRLQPVTWNGRFTEVGVAVNEAGNPSTGNIDLIVRRGDGGNRGFLVFEIKKPGCTSIESALKQAIRYATALAIEANDDGKDNLVRYHRAFGSRGKVAMPIGAVVVLEDCPKVRKEGPTVLQRYWKTRGKSKIDRIGLLLYKKNENGLTYEWLENWDARKKPNP